MINYQQVLERVFATNAEHFNVPESLAIQRLTVIINRLIVEDFAKLVQILYTLDISEKRLKQRLNTFPKQDAAMLMAEMIIERQKQKAITKNKYRPSSATSDAEEKW